MRLGIPRDVSLDGPLVDGVLGYLTLCTGIAFAVLIVVLAATLIFHRARAGRPHAHHTHGDGLRARLLTFGVGLTLFVAIDVTLAVRASGHLRDRFWNYPDADPNALRVEVTARQWAWTFRTAGPDGQFATPDDVVTLNELHVPIGRARLPEAALEGRDPFLLRAELPHQDRRHPGQHDAPLVPGAGGRPLRGRLRPALRRQPLQDARLG